MSSPATGPFAPDPPPAAEAPTNVRWRVFALACGTSFLLYLHRYSWNIVGPELQRDFGLTNAQSGFLFSLFYYTYAAGQIPSGVVIDRFGPHACLSVSILLWSVAVAGIGRATSLGFLAAWRLVFGAGQAGGYPALTKVTRNWFPVARRTMLQGWIATACGRGGGALSPLLIGTLLIGTLGLSWRASLVILGMIGIAFAGLLWATFRDTPADDPRVNAAERALIAEGSIPASGDRLARSQHLPPRRAVRNRSLWFFCAQQYLDAGSDVVFVSLLGAYFLQARGFDMAKTGWVASLPLWGGAIGGIVGGWLNDRTITWSGNRRWSRSGVGFVGKILGGALLALVTQAPDGVTAAWLLFAAKFFSDWSQPTVWGTCTDLGGRFSATVFSIINTAGTLGGVVMPPVFGRLLDHFTSGEGPAQQTDWGPLFVLLTLMYLGSGLCWLMIDCTRTLDTNEPD